MSEIKTRATQEIALTEGIACLQVDKSDSDNVPALFSNNGDLEVITESGGVIRVDSHLLAEKSAFFKAMVNCPMKETSNRYEETKFTYRRVYLSYSMDAFALNLISYPVFKSNCNEQNLY